MRSGSTDPYGPHSLTREVARILWREWPMEIHLDDLGDGFSVRALNAGNDFQTTAQAGRFTIRPGVYLLQRPDIVTDQWKTAPLAAHVRLDEFVALPETTTSWVVRHEPPIRWRSGLDLPVRFTMVGDTNPVRVELVSCARRPPFRTPRRSPARPRLSVRGDDSRRMAGGRGFCVCIGRSHRREDATISRLRPCRCGPEWVARQDPVPAVAGRDFRCGTRSSEAVGQRRIFADASAGGRDRTDGPADFRGTVRAAAECRVVSTRGR